LWGVAELILTGFLTDTPVQAWHFLNFDDVWAYDQFWYIQRVPGVSSAIYTVNNIKSGTVLEIAGGQSYYDVAQAA
jgi:hypothetical protein